MAFAWSGLALLAGHQGKRIWSYNTADTAATVDTAGYFNSVANFLNVGDVIMANVDTGGTPGYGIFVVNANSGTVVDVADMTNLAAADTD